jgi:predicted nucleic acid-binding protein
MLVVADASAVCEILLGRPKAYRFESALQKASFVLAPDLYVSELSNVLWKQHRDRLMSKNDCLESISDGIDYVDSFISAKTIWQEAFLLGAENDHSPYDTMYAEIARKNAATLITNDRKLAEICKNNGIQVFI